MGLCLESQKDCLCVADVHAQSCNKPAWLLIAELGNGTCGWHSLVCSPSAGTVAPIHGNS